MAGRRRKWIGIDFGTTNSASISFVDEGNSIGRYEHGDDQGKEKNMGTHTHGGSYAHGDMHRGGETG